MKKNKAFQKVFSKNYLKMNNLAWSKPDLLMPGILDIRERLGIDKKLPVIDPAKDKNRYDEFIKLGNKKMRDFHNNNEEKLFGFYKDLGEIRKQLHLGREWNPTLARFAISGIFLPPPFSVFISENEEDKTITFELNKDTTQDDLNLAWKNIEDTRKKMYGKLRASFPTKKTIKNFNKYTAYQVAKYENKTAIDAVNNKKYKKRDIDIIGEIYSSENNMSEKADKKRLNKLKVAKHRFKKITS